MASYVDMNLMLNDITQAIQGALNDSMTEYLKNEYKNAMNKTIYSRPSGEYERTYSARDSVTVDISRSGAYGIEIALYADPKKMSNYYPAVTKNSPKDQREYIVEWLDQGNERTGSLWTYPASNYLDLAYSNITKDSGFISLLKRKLRSIGIHTT